MKIREILSEAPLADYELLGDFDKPGSFNDSRDKKLLTKPVHKQKMIKFFENTNEDFRIFPVNAPGLRQFSETGMVSETWIRDVFDNMVKQPTIADTILNGYQDSITIVYVSNTGVNKVVMTPWIVAHRFGHAIQASARKKGLQSWAYAEEYFFNGINEVLNEVYKLPSVKGFHRQYTPYYNALFNAIGMQRSSRQGLITRPYEFLYESFTSYLQSGSMNFNPLPKSLPYGKAAWGKKASLNASPDIDLEYELGTLENTLEYAFGDVIGECIGKIFVM